MDERFSSSLLPLVYYPAYPTDVINLFFICSKPEARISFHRFLNRQSIHLIVA
jgi:hypothetical protein